MKIKIKQRQNKEWDFRIVGDNGEIMLVSESYHSKSNMKRAIKNFILNMHELDSKYNSESKTKLNENINNLEIEKD